MAATATPPLVTERLLRRKTVKEITGKSDAGLYNDKTFPRPIKIGARASAWIASEVEAWIQAKIAAARPPAKDPPARNQVA
jgi:prophage regulatory protein